MIVMLKCQFDEALQAHQSEIDMIKIRSARDAPVPLSTPTTKTSKAAPNKAVSSEAGGASQQAGVYVINFTE